MLDVRVVGEVLVVGVVVVGVPARATVVAVVACTVVVMARWLPLPHPATNAVSATLAQIHREEIAIVRGEVSVGRAVHAR